MDSCIYSTTNNKSSIRTSSTKSNVRQQLLKLRSRIRPHGIHSCIKMTTAGFQYTGDGDTVHCNMCNLDVSDWTAAMDPFSVHAERNPQCPFVLSKLLTNQSQLEDQENPPKRQKTSENSHKHSPSYKFVEVNTLKEIRHRSFSHWPHQFQPSVAQMIAAGFFSCTVGDRVICIYCNLICQQWQANQDDPSEVHQTLSPQCPYVLAKLMHPEQSSTVILNDNSTVTSNNLDQQRFDQIVYTRPCHEHYSDITKRMASFASWTEQSAPPVDELVRAGFFYTGTGNVLTCFYCGGSLQNWGATDNPVNEHVRWFAHCPYAKQLCGDDMHRRIQEANRLRQERQRSNRLNERNGNNHENQINTDDDRLVQRMVAARLDLGNSQRMLDKPFKLSVIKRCWEDQLRLKKDDFVSDTDLFMSCSILQKQIDCIQGNKDNIVIPNQRMQAIRDGQQTTPPAPSAPLTTTTNNSETNTKPPENQPISTPIVTEEQSNTSKNEKSLSNPCIICFQDEKRLACIPCGHLTACVPCSHSLRTCPVCRRSIEAFVRVYI